MKTPMHGTIARYQSGCRCCLCLAGWRTGRESLQGRPLKRLGRKSKAVRPGSEDRCIFCGGRKGLRFLFRNRFGPKGPEKVYYVCSDPAAECLARGAKTRKEVARGR